MKTKLIRVMAACALLAATAEPLAAQGPGGGGWGGRRGGNGGPGAGMFGQRGPGGMFGRMGGMPNRDPLVTHVMELIYRPDVQTELHMDIRQKNALTEYQTTAQQTMAQQMRQFFQTMRQQRGQAPGADQGAGVDRNAMRQQMREQMQTQFAEVQSKLAGGLSDILRPEQIARLHQLDLQWRGVLSIADPKVAEEVKASQEHRTELAALAQEYQAKSRESRQQAFQAMRDARQANGGPNAQAGTPPPNPQALFAAIDRADATARKAAEEKALAALTDGEKAQWTAAQGRPFVFRQLGQTG